MIDLHFATDRALLNGLREHLAELRQRQLIRTGRGFTADRAEDLVTAAYQLTRADHACVKDYDAKADGKLYQIKGRAAGKLTMTGFNDPRTAAFDILVVVFFDADYRVVAARWVTRGAIVRHQAFRQASRGYRVDLGKIPPDDWEDVTLDMLAQEELFDRRDAQNR